MLCTIQKAIAEGVIAWAIEDSLNAQAHSEYFGRYEYL